MAPTAATKSIPENPNQVSLLFEVSQILDKTFDLKQVIVSVLYHVASNLALVRGSITLLNRQSGEISIESSYGLTGRAEARALQAGRGHHRPGRPNRRTRHHP